MEFQYLQESFLPIRALHHKMKYPSMEMETEALALTSRNVHVYHRESYSKYSKLFHLTDLIARMLL